MKFQDAMSYLLDNKRVARAAWTGFDFVEMLNDKITLFTPVFVPWAVDNDILLTHGWRVEGNKNRYKFYEILTYLKNGVCVYHDEWSVGDKYIVYSPEDGKLILHYMGATDKLLDLDSLFAKDWVLVKYK